MAALDPRQPLLRNPDLVAADMDGETVMMSVERGEYFGLGGTGSRVWQLLAQPCTLAELAASVAAEYEVDPQTCAADLRGFLEDLLARGLVSAA